MRIEEVAISPSCGLGDTAHPVTLMVTRIFGLSVIMSFHSVTGQLQVFSDVFVDVT
jgi:hypothetical protein